MPTLAIFQLYCGVIGEGHRPASNWELYNIICIKHSSLILTLSVPDEGYYRIALYTLNLISTYLVFFTIPCKPLSTHFVLERPYFYHSNGWHKYAQE